MKNFKKLLALLLAIVMIFAVGATAVFADTEEPAGDDPTGGETPTNPGSITINDSVEGKLYDLYRIFDLTGTNPDEETGVYANVAYTIASKWTGFFATGAAGADYIDDTQPEGGNLNPISINGATKYINITEDNVAAFAQAALAYASANNINADKTATGDGDDLVVDDLELGYYMVYPRGAADIKDSYASICSLTSTIPAAEINIKADYPEITKEVDDKSVEVGQVVTFTVTGKVPDTTGYTKYTYKFTDTMDVGLTFNDTVDNITVKFGDASIAVPETGKVTYTIADNGFILDFDMTKYQDYVGEEITITYQAVVNDGAVATLTENTIKLTYSNNPKSSTTEDTPEIDVPVYTSKIVIDKYDGNAISKKLEGAEFVLVKKTTTGEDTTESFYKYTAATSTAAAKVEWVSSIDSATVVTTDKNGAASFKGLEDGTYYLRETAAPEGYNLLTEDVTVTVIHTENDDEKPIGVSVASEVANNSGTVLPSTGGMGTVIFITVGAIVVLGAGIILTAKKRLYNAG